MLSGYRKSGNEAQLAVFDAMVFFAVCLLTCSLLISNAQHSQRSQLDAALASDQAETLLRVYLASSLGVTMEIDRSGLIVTGHESIADIVATMVELRLDGVDMSPYTGIMAACGSVLSNICPDCWSPEMRAFRADATEMIPLLSFGEHEDRDSDRISASQTITTRDEIQVLLVLTLSPALPSHLVPV